jgi:hypothetical protein
MAKPTGRNTRKGEYNVHILIIIIKNRTPSLKTRILLFPEVLFCAFIGKYLTLRPSRNTPSVIVVGYE